MLVLFRSRRPVALNVADPDLHFTALDFVGVGVTHEPRLEQKVGRWLVNRTGEAGPVIVHPVLRFPLVAVRVLGLAWLDEGVHGGSDAWGRVTQ